MVSSLRDFYWVWDDRDEYDGNTESGTLISIFNVYVCFVSLVTSFKDSTCFKIHTKILVLYIFTY